MQMKKSLSLLVLGMFLAVLSLPLAYAGEHGGSDTKEHGGTAAAPAAAPAAEAAVNEDANGNGVLDEGEDTNGNGVLDTADEEEAEDEE